MVTAVLVERSSTAFRTLPEFRCVGTKRDGTRCNKLLVEMHADAIQVGRSVIVKCDRCDALVSFVAVTD